MARVQHNICTERNKQTRKKRENRKGNTEEMNLQTGREGRRCVEI
jgi:hypothetical protein